MKQITQEQIENALESFETFTEADIQKFMRTFQKKQEPLLVYIAAVAEREELNEEEYDLLITMVLLTWQLIRLNFPKMKKLTMKQLERMDDLLYERLANDPNSMLQAVHDYPQPFLHEAVLTNVMEAEEAVREDRKGIIYFTLKNVMDGMISGL
ncbi:hypothetical protein L0222_22345 [bacterium]|nr:hypothetical protein [bacterium]MCI0605522.1 hypothetical protein [bacterium]